MNKIDFTREGREVLSLESRALRQLADRLDAGFSRACELLLACEGRVIVVGMGKSGHIGGKIAATLASTGTPAFLSTPEKPVTGTWG